MSSARRRSGPITVRLKRVVSKEKKKKRKKRVVSGAQAAASPASFSIWHWAGNRRSARPSPGQEQDSGASGLGPVVSALFAGCDLRQVTSLL